MSCLDVFTKIAMMLDQLATIKKMLADDSIRPNTRARLEDDKHTIRNELKKMYLDLYKIIEN
jgi:hypothetical protein